MDTLTTPSMGRRRLSPERLKRAMLGRGLTVRELAGLSDLHLSTVYAALAGRPILPRSEIAIVRALDAKPVLQVVEDVLAEVG